jgi:hypothetical protein
MHDGHRRSQRAHKPKIKFCGGETLRDKRKGKRYVKKRKRQTQNPHGNFKGERDIRKAAATRVAPLIVHTNTQSVKVRLFFIQFTCIVLSYFIYVCSLQIKQLVTQAKETDLKVQALLQQVLKLKQENKKFNVIIEEKVFM